MSEKKVTDRKRARVLVVPLEQPIDPFWTTSDAVEQEGVFLRTTQLLPEGSTCLLKMLFGDRDLWMRTRVVHHIAGIGFGCRFIEIDRGKQELLSTWLMDGATLPRAVEGRPRSSTPL